LQSKHQGGVARGKKKKADERAGQKTPVSGKNPVMASGRGKKKKEKKRVSYKENSL